MDVASGLAGGPVVALEPAIGGGNNRVFCIERQDGARFALKTYLTSADDGAERLAAEFGGLCFLWDRGLPLIPEPLAYDDAAGCALYGWVEGDTGVAVSDADIDAAAEFAARLKRLTGAYGSHALPLAREACLSGADVIAQIKARFLRLCRKAEAHAALADFLYREFTPAFLAESHAARTNYAVADLDFAAPITEWQRTLSPSDFGFHNALRRPDGTLVFLDFEYFGWDDPVKLVADFLWHPGMALSTAQKCRFVGRVGAPLAHGDATFMTRLSALYPMFGLRWCMIVLNEFLAEGWRRRAYAGMVDRAEAQSHQLAKARALLGRITGRESGTTGKAEGADV